MNQFSGKRCVRMSRGYTRGLGRGKSQVPEICPFMYQCFFFLAKRSKTLIIFAYSQEMNEQIFRKRGIRIARGQRTGDWGPDATVPKIEIPTWENVPLFVSKYFLFSQITFAYSQDINDSIFRKWGIVILTGQYSGDQGNGQVTSA